MLPKNRTTWMIGLILLLLTFVVLGIYLFPGVSTPPVYLAEQHPYEQSDGIDPYVHGVFITPENVQQVIEDLSRIPAYSREIAQTRYFTGGAGVSTSYAHIWVNEYALRIRFDSGENIIFTPEVYHLWQLGRPHITRQIPDFMGGTLYAILDGFQGIPSWEIIRTLDPADIIAAGSTRVMIDNIYHYAIYVTVTDPLFGYRDTYYIDLSTGLLIAMTTYDGYNPIYRFDTISLARTAPAADIFHLPDGTPAI